MISDRETDFRFTGLKKSSLIKPNKIATIIKSRVVYRLGNLTPGLLDNLDASLLALLRVGGRRIEKESILIPYGRQWIDDRDILEVVRALSSDWITQGPKIEEYEKKVSGYCGVKYGVAVSSGTAALHAACFAAGIKPGDEVITSPITFVASANSVLYQGGRPVFADIQPDTMNIDPIEIEKKVTSKTKAIIPVDFAGHPCDLDEIKAIAKRHNLIVIEDACHALGAEYKGKKVGSLSDMTIFSFHPVKHITTGEDGMVLTNSKGFYEKLKIFRHHGITKDPADFINKDLALNHNSKVNPWFYEMQHLGYNYRITDFQCALGLSQMEKLDSFVQRRREIAARYNEAFAEVKEIITPIEGNNVKAAYHIYVIQIREDMLKIGRNEIFKTLRAENIGVNVHYIPVHLQPYYQKKFGYKKDDYPISEKYYERAITLPIFPKMRNEDVENVIKAIVKVIGCYRRNS